MKMKCPHCGVKGSVSDALLGRKVKCPKCNSIFKVTEEQALATPAIDPQKEPVIEVTGQVSDAAPSHGMTAQDEAELEEEIAKIFEDMKKPGPDQGGSPAAADSTGGAVGEGPQQTDTAPISEEDLKSELENILGEKCSVCGAFVGQATKFELAGNVYCASCLPEEKGTGEETESPKDLTVSGTPDMTQTAAGFWKKERLLIAGVAIIALILFAAYFLTAK